jgi:O-antigen ligase
MSEIVYTLFCVLLVSSPLTLGARGTLSLAFLEIISMSALTMHLWSGIRKKNPYYAIPGLLPLMILILFMIVQILPMPSAVVRIVSPAIYRFYESTLGIMGPMAMIPLTLNIKASVKELLRFTSYSMVYWLCVQILVDKHRLKKTVLMIAGLGAGISVYALIERFFSNGKIFWLFVLPEGNTHMGPYVYKNHYAGFIEMVFPVVFAAFLYYKPKIRYGTFRETLLETLTTPYSNIHILLGFSALLMATSQFVSFSRGGTVCLSLSMIVFLAMLGVFQNGKTGRKAIWAMVFFFVLVLAVGWFGWDSIYRNFEVPFTNSVVDLNGRTVFWKDSMGIIRDFPLTGTGFGTFADIYPSYRTFPGNFIVDHAHSDIVELAVTGGVIGVFLVSWFLIDVMVSCLRMLGKRREQYSGYMIVGTFSGVLALLFHSVTDFNYYSNANGLYFFLLIGLMVSAAHTRLRSSHLTYLKNMDFKKWWVIVAPITAVFLFCLWFNLGGIFGGLSFSRIENLAINSQMDRDELSGIQSKAFQSISVDPLEARYRVAAAIVSDYQDQESTALKQYRWVMFLEPANVDYIQQVARYMTYRGEDDKASELLKTSVERGRKDVDNFKRYASYLLSKGNMDEGFGALRIAMDIDPGVDNEYECIAVMVDNGISVDKFADAMPEKVYPRYYLADYLRKRNKTHLADKIEDDAMSFLKNETRYSPWMFLRIYHRKFSEKDYDAALSVINLGLSYLPDNPDLVLAAAKAYEFLGIKFKALEAYRKAVILSPENRIVKRKIQLLEEE